MPWPRQSVLASEPSIREQNLDHHYKALTPCLAAAVLHARPAEAKTPQMTMTQSQGQAGKDRDAQME
ncbi:MAG: hypothetical protein P0Y66_11985 [Candidatus Kaistia colombiensis]|nr:MAG: hypothetical protein P0Y66_11985 [Kaistia sp.]